MNAMYRFLNKPATINNPIDYLMRFTLKRKFDLACTAPDFLCLPKQVLKNKLNIKIIYYMFYF